MSQVFADTFYFIALLNRKDADHSKALAFAQSGTLKILTTAWILTELADAMVDVTRRHQFHPLFVALESDATVEIVPPHEDLWRRGIELYASRPDNKWSLTDCISFLVMQDRQLTDAPTGDHHFEQAGFRALLK